MNQQAGVPTVSLVSEGECYDATIDYFKIIQEMSANDLMLPLGTSYDDGRAVFANGDCAFYSQFISGFTATYNAVGGAFTVGFHEAPTINADVAPTLAQVLGQTLPQADGICMQKLLVR